MISQQHDWTYNINNQKQVTLDVGEWDRISAQFVAPIVGVISVYGTNDGGAIRGVTNGNASLATNFNAVQVTNLATGTATNTISAAGTYKYDVNTKYIRFSAPNVNVYKLIVDNMKIY